MNITPIRAFQTVVLMFLPAAAGLGGGSCTMVMTRPKPSADILFNPRMGLYMQFPPLDLPRDHWMLQVADIAYYRLDWAAVNPKKNVYTFDKRLGPIFDRWVKQEHKRVAFRFMSSNMHSHLQYVTPKWVFDQGVPGVRHQSVYGTPQMDPVFWDKRYLDIQCRFIAALGRYLDKKPGLEFVDIGAIGEWGEMHLSRWSQKQLIETGYTHTRYVEAYRRIIDAYAGAFPNTIVFLNVGGRNNLTIDDYAATRGVHFRQDGLAPSGASYHCGQWLYPAYAPRGVLCNFEFFSDFPEMVRKGWSLHQTIDKALAAPISYLNTNLGFFYARLPGSARKEIIRAGQHIGYRLLPVRVHHPDRVETSEHTCLRFPVFSVWRNEGIAQPTLSFAEEWALAAEDGRILAKTRTYPAIPTTLWKPGKEYTAPCSLSIPKNLPVGTCHLLVSLVSPEQNRRIALGIAGRRPDAWYEISSLKIVRVADPPSVLRRWTFTNGLDGWTPADGVRLQITSDAGNRFLRMTGRKNQAWSYAACAVPMPLAMPCGRIHLTGRMRVITLAPKDTPAPYFKIGTSDRNGDWIENFQSTQYDMTHKGRWQTLDLLICELPPNAAQWTVAVEAGTFGGPTTVRLDIDNLTLSVESGPRP